MTTSTPWIHCVFFFIDVKRPHFCVPCRRTICVEIPPEDQENGEDMVGLLKQNLYGTRDAASNWEAEVQRVMSDVLKFEVGRASPCNFYHEQRQWRTTVHGDDITTLGKVSQLQWLEAQLAQQWQIEVKGLFGPPSVQGSVQEMKHLNRTYRWKGDSITWEADERHSRILLQKMGFEGRSASKVTTPLVREKWNVWGESEQDEESDKFLGPERKNRFQSMAMRLSRIPSARSHRSAKGGLKTCKRHGPPRREALDDA